MKLNNDHFIKNHYDESFESLCRCFHLKFNTNKKVKLVSRKFLNKFLMRKEFDDDQKFQLCKHIATRLGIKGIEKKVADEDN